jgi:hemoglobin
VGTTASIVDDLRPRLLGDPSLAVYWKGKCKDSLRKDRQLIVDFLGAAFGGPVVYLGRPMKMSIAALVPVPGNDRASRALQQ